MTKTAMQAAPEEAMECARTVRLVRPSTSRIEEDGSSDGCDIGAGGYCGKIFFGVSGRLLVAFPGIVC